MPTLLEEVQAHLAGQYRIERELGGGGMSKVFLAEDTGLSRKVVLKLTPPEFAAVVSPERFQREVRIAAGLQHPNIVPLLSAGRAGDLIYYTMPFVEGESLRERLGRERELPVPESIRLLREVADALAYAHRQGVVHRDIKPDNVLLSHGHAVVTDFGIAKALTEAGGAGTLTATGVSIGTPAYMAPEQAGGDQVDHRADLYSLGVLGYEMLAGEPPFRGATAQALIGAQLTRAPTPIAELRPAVPGGLAAVIHRCLEKRPADRFQSADELMGALDALTLPHRPEPTPISRSGPREWRLPRVLGLFAFTGAIVLALAWALRTLAGLPDWFFPAAVILLAIGLPVVVAATVAHNRHAIRPPSRFTLRRAAWGGVAAFTALGLVTGTYMGMRTLGIGPVGTLVAAGKLNARERLIIAEFANNTRDSLLGPAVTQAFRVDFAQSRLVSPVESDYVRRVLRRMQRPDSTTITLDVAREIAQREGFNAVVSGEIQQVGPSLLISARVVTADSGEVLYTARATAADSSRILEAVDRVSKKLREKIGESLRSLRTNPPLEQVTTSSVEALRKYSQAIQAESIGDEVREIQLLEEAVATDSNFAMAWRKLGTVLQNNLQRQERAAEAIGIAYRHRDRLTFRERKLTEATYFVDSSDPRGLDSAVTALESLLAEYPRDSWARNNLGVVQFFAGEDSAARVAYREAIALEHENFLSWRNLFGIHARLADFDSAAATLAVMRELFPAGPQMDELDVILLLAQREFAAAEPLVREQLQRYRTDSRTVLRLQRWLGGILTVRGKLAEADRALLASAELFAARGQPGLALEQRARRAPPAALYRSDPRAARQILDEALRAQPLAAIPERDRPILTLIQVAMEAEEPARARALAAEFARSLGNLPGRARRFGPDFVHGAVLSMETATLPQGIARLHRARQSPARHRSELALAEAFDRAGSPDSALAYYEKWDAAGDDWDGPIYLIKHPVAWFRMAELFEAAGQREKAIERYGKFTEVWRDADPELQPQVRTARRRLEELTAERR